MDTPLFVIKNIFEHELVPAFRVMSARYNESNNNSMLDITDNLCDITNKIVTDCECSAVIATFNPDKPKFGVYVSPTIIDSDLTKFIFDKEDMKLTRYSAEIDLGMFDLLTPEEVAAVYIEEITTVMSKVTIDKVRGIFETIMTDRDLTINFRESVNFSQLLIFGIKDTIRKVASCIYKPEDELGTNEYAIEFGYNEALKTIIAKLHTFICDGMAVEVNPKLSVLSWVLSVYNEPSINYRLMLEDLNAALALTGSKLEQDEVSKTITSLRRATNETLVETVIKEDSLFKNLKQNGLRSIEDDLYEYKIRVKTCETEDDAMYILHQVSTRINILEDYLYNTPNLSEYEIQRWTNVINAYKQLRLEISKKPIVDKKRYGIFVDYDYLDRLDNKD